MLHSLLKACLQICLMCELLKGDILMPQNNNITDEEEIMSEEEKNEVTENPENEAVSDSETEALKKELETQKDQFLRMAAEYDNFRKLT